MRDWLHRAFRGHEPDWVQLGPELICLTCDLKPPSRGFRITQPLPEGMRL